MTCNTSLLLHRFNAYGQLGTEDTSQKSTPTEIEADDEGTVFTAAACGHDHTALITGKGAVLASKARWLDDLREYNSTRLGIY